jgi:hypothetical protein
MHSTRKREKRCHFHKINEAKQENLTNVNRLFSVLFNDHQRVPCVTSKVSAGCYIDLIPQDIRVHPLHDETKEGLPLGCRCFGYPFWKC